MDGKHAREGIKIHGSLITIYKDVKTEGGRVTSSMFSKKGTSVRMEMRDL